MTALPQLKRSLPLMLLAVAAAAWASEEEDMAAAWGDKAMVSIATGRAQPIKLAPAATSVITAAEIRAMGATDLDQVLETVAGVHVGLRTNGQPLTSVYYIRGISTFFNPQVLVLVNGIAITNSFLGNRSFVWGGMPLENVARIEVIRGPGSALYGADAVSGVINIITKTADDIHGLEFGSGAGSFQSRLAWLQYGGQLGPIRASAFLRLAHTNGQDGIIEKDAQSARDALANTHLSLAPGSISASGRALDARVDLSWQDWRLRAAVQKREQGMGAGMSDSLAPDDRLLETRWFLDISYDKKNILPDWHLAAVIGTNQFHNPLPPSLIHLFPAGAPGAAFPNGVIGTPSHDERDYHASITASHTGFKQHRLRMGLGYKLDDLYDATNIKNFRFVIVPGVGPAIRPLPALADVRGDPDLVFIDPVKRNVRYAFVQDEWELAQDWILTAGLRHDHYSDFGGTTNPRLALVWNAHYNFVVKALHGRAFRAPSFAEQYTKNNPVNIGNPNLRPEKIVTNELVFAWRPTTTLQTSLSLFQHRLNDIIISTSNTDPSTGRTYHNAANQNGRGLELETNWQARTDLRVSASWSVQHSTDSASGKDAGLAPHQRLLLRTDWQIAPAWQLGSIVNHVAGRQREPGDTRPKIADYSMLDLSLRRENLGNWELRATLLNALNRDAREPALAPGNTPYDLPLPRRALNLELVYKL
jgi:iron complex outermembrane receptor protein